MTDTPTEDEKPDADAAFERTLRNLVSTPPTPHKPKDADDAHGTPERPSE